MLPSVNSPTTRLETMRHPYRVVSHLSPPWSSDRKRHVAVLSRLVATPQQTLLDTIEQGSACDTLRHVAALSLSAPFFNVVSRSTYTLPVCLLRVTVCDASAAAPSRGPRRRRPIGPTPRPHGLKAGAVAHAYPAPRRRSGRPQRPGAEGLSATFKGVAARIAAPTHVPTH